MDVGDVLRDRMQDPAGLQRLIVVSCAVHTAIAVALLFAPALRAAPAPSVKQAPQDAKGRTPTRGPETRAGSTVAETGTRGQGFGLSTGGGPGSGSTLDVADFCCPDYLLLMIESIRRSWNQSQSN